MIIGRRGDADKARADPANTHASLLNLRLTNRDIGKEAEEVKDLVG
jgi:hypothetical protein